MRTWDDVKKDHDRRDLWSGNLQETLRSLKGPERDRAGRALLDHVEALLDGFREDLADCSEEPEDAVFLSAVDDFLFHWCVRGGGRPLCVDAADRDALVRSSARGEWT